MTWSTRSHKLKRLTIKKHPRYRFTIPPARSKQHKAIKLADTEFDDDIALWTNTIAKAQKLQHTVEEVMASKNESKNKYINEAINNGTLPVDLVRLLRELNDFSYLGARMISSEANITARKALVWVASHKLKEICKYDLRKEIKIIPFVALMDSKH